MNNHRHKILLLSLDNSADVGCVSIYIYSAGVKLAIVNSHYSFVSFTRPCSRIIRENQRLPVLGSDAHVVSKAGCPLRAAEQVLVDVSYLL